MNARRIALALVLVSSPCAIALAGEVYGKVVEGGAPVGDAVSLEASCGGKSYPAVKTDKSGSFRMVLKETGKCSLTVQYKGQSAKLDIASYDDAVQIDLVLELKDQKLSVRRK